MCNSIRVTYRSSAISRLAGLAFVVLLFSAIPIDAAAAARSNAGAITLVAHVAPVLRLQASSPAATGATANVSSSGQNVVTLEIAMDGDDGALINIPIVVRTNVNDVLFRANIKGLGSGYIWMDGGEALVPALTSRPMPVGSNVTFALASGLLRNTRVPLGSPLSGTIGISIPPGSVPQGQLVILQITMEALRQ
jgi:hypothetical protein